MECFSLHHLSHDEKARFFKLSNQVLSEDGVLIVYDILPEKETRDEYLERYLNDFIANDYPEPFEVLNSMSQQGGFRSGDLVFRDERKMYGVMVFSKMNSDYELHPPDMINN